MNITFQELKKKCVIDTVSGKNLGKVCDLIFDSESGKIIKLIVSGSKSTFLSSNKMEIDFVCITKIGEDSILYKKCVIKQDKCENTLPPCDCFDNCE